MKRIERPKHGQHRLGHAHQAEKVGLEHGADLLVLALLDRGHVAVAGIVHEHVDAAEGVTRRLHRRRHLGRLGDVQRHGLAAAAGAVLEVLHVLGLARGGDQTPAAVEHELGEFAPEAGGAAGDEPDGIGGEGHGGSPDAQAARETSAGLIRPP